MAVITCADGEFTCPRRVPRDLLRHCGVPMIPPVRNELHETEEDDNSEDDPEDQPAHDSRVARDSSGLVVVRLGLRRYQR